MAIPKGRLPAEYASKLGHLEFMDDPVVRDLLTAFQAHEPPAIRGAERFLGSLGPPRGKTDITHVVAVDAGMQDIPSRIFPARQMVFIKATQTTLALADLRNLANRGLRDPREKVAGIDTTAPPVCMPIPLCGISLPGLNMKDAIRRVLIKTLEHTRNPAHPSLLDTYEALLWETWRDPHMAGYPTDRQTPSMKCRNPDCSSGRTVMIPVPWGQRQFHCPSCWAEHHSIDYLGLLDEVSDHQAEPNVANNIRDLIETLILFARILYVWRTNPSFLKRILFMKDGSLMMGQSMGRIVEPIRRLIEAIKDRGDHLRLMGVEKSGRMVDSLPFIGALLQQTGDYFLPSVRFIREDLKGINFVPSIENYRHEYGSKIILRLGPLHVVVLTIPTFGLEPKVDDLIGLQDIYEALAPGLLSYTHDNALIPNILANRFASISESPGRDLLEELVRKGIAAAAT